MTQGLAGGKAKGNAWYSQLFGGSKGGAGGGGGGGAEAGAEEDTCAGGVCKNPPAKYQGGGGSGSSQSSQKAGVAIIKVDALCKHSLGRGAEFDGIDSCRCSAGNVHKNGQCVAEIAAAAPAAAASRHTGGAGVQRRDAAFERYTHMCQQDYGAFVEFDGVGGCKCVEGYQDVGGTCVPASAAGRSDQSSKGAAAAGQHAAAAAKAAEKAKYDKMCEAQYAHSEYSVEQKECVCQQGFMEIEGQGCVPDRKSSGRASGTHLASLIFTSMFR